MTDREIVEWVAQAEIGQALPWGVTYVRVVDAMSAETGFRDPAPGEAFFEGWCLEAKEHARRVVDSETWRADALK